VNTDQFSVDGETAIITGSSSGIGKSIAERFAADGVDVVVCSREQENVDPVAEGINESDSPGRALPVECDVTDREAVDALVDALVEEFGGLDVLVNNAGASFMAQFDEISPNGWKTIVDININGTYHCTHAAAEYLKDGGGSVINLASVAGQRGSPLMSLRRGQGRRDQPDDDALLRVGRRRRPRQLHRAGLRRDAGRREPDGRLRG